MNAGELGSDFQQVWLWDATHMVHKEHCLAGKQMGFPHTFHILSSILITQVVGLWGFYIVHANFFSPLHFVLCQLSTQEEADGVEAFFASRMKPTFAMTLKQNIEKIRIKARWVESIKQEQSLPELIKGLACRVWQLKICLQCYIWILQRFRTLI